MKDALIVEQKVFPIKGPWGGVFKGEEDDCRDLECTRRTSLGDMLGNVSRTSGRVLAV